jgi:hypothetical protein
MFMSNIICSDNDDDEIKKDAADDKKINFRSQILPDHTHLDIICNVVRLIPLKITMHMEVCFCP